MPIRWLIHGAAHKGVGHVPGYRRRIRAPRWLKLRHTSRKSGVRSLAVYVHFKLPTDELLPKSENCSYFGEYFKNVNDACRLG